MAEYINKKDLIDFIKDTRQRLPHDSKDFFIRDNMLLNFEQIVSQMTAADVAEVRHGKWVRMEDDFVYWYACSECKERIPKTEYGNDYWSDYCPRCGTIMDLGDDEE